MKSFNAFVDDETHDLLMAINNGASLTDAMREVTIKHADRLAALGDVRAVALDPCPRCGGRVVAGENEARCTAGCDWSYRRHGAAT